MTQIDCESALRAANTNPLTAEGIPVSNEVTRPTRAAARWAVALALSWVAGFAAVALVPDLLTAQGTGRITGTVTGDGRQPLSDVQVVIPGTSFGATTNAEGRYNILNVPAGTHPLRAQRLGYSPAAQTVTVRANETATAPFELTAVPTSLAAVVTTGYTTQQRRDVSDAVSSVRADDIQDQQVATVEEALRGRVPGVQISASGEPGRPAQVIIRGQNFLGNPTPLYVVDGMYLRQNPNLNPDDIESIEVLKDASAAAQYGSQAANGVIVIRTRRGRASDNNRVEVRSYYGTQDVANRIEMMNAQEWATIQQQAYTNAGQAVPAGVTAALNGSVPTTDWQDAVFRRGAIQDHNLAVSGGTSNASYLITGGVLDQQGALVETSFRRYSVRVNSDAQRGRFRIGENIALSRAKRDGLENAGFPLVDVVRMLPVIPVRDPNNASGYGYGSGANPTFGTNPVGLLERQTRDERSNQVIGSAFAEYRLLPFLSYRLNLGVNYEAYARSEFNSIAQIRMGSPNQYATLNEIRNDFTSLLAENLLQYEGAFSADRHRVNAVAGYMEQRDNADDITGFRRSFSDERLRNLSAGGEEGQTTTGVPRQTVLQSFLLRANYSLLGRYLLTGSVRRDGSSRFGPNNRWGTFSALSAGWIVSDEGFYKSVPVLSSANYLKLRASTGTLGNQDIGDYGYTAPIEINRLGYPYAPTGPIESGATQLVLANPDIRWQDNRQTNIGLDLGVLEDRLTLTADWYRSTSTGLLVRAPLPWSLGVGEDPLRLPFVNAGSMRNTGFELGTTYRYGGRDEGAFRLSTTGTLTTTKNRVLSLGNGGQPLFDQTGAARTAVGSAIGTFYLVETAGIFQSAGEVPALVAQPGAQRVDVLFLAATGSVKMT